MWNIQKPKKQPHGNVLAFRTDCMFPCKIWALHGYKCALKITVFLDVTTCSLVDR